MATPHDPREGRPAELRASIAADLWQPDEAVAHLLGGRAVSAIVLYGSHLLERRAAAQPDFFVIVDSLVAYHASHSGIGGALTNSILPPNVYQVRQSEGRAAPHCKVSVLSRAQLARETSPRAADLYHLGRFSKPLRVVFARDSRAFLGVVEAQAAAFEIMAPLALGLLGARFTVEEFMRTLFGLSYLGEHRIVEPDKVETIFRFDSALHLKVGRLLLAENSVRTLDGRRYHQPPDADHAARTARWIARSRRRALMRWPKYLWTFDGWLAYSLSKLERHTGRRVELGPLERRWPLLFGWPTFLSLTRAGLIR